MSLSFYYTPKVCTTGSEIYVWASSIFFLKKMDWVKGKQGEKKRSRQYSRSYLEEHDKEASVTGAGSEIEIPTRYLISYWACT